MHSLPAQHVCQQSVEVVTDALMSSIKCLLRVLSSEGAICSCIKMYMDTPRAQSVITRQCKVCHVRIMVMLQHS